MELPRLVLLTERGKASLVAERDRLKTELRAIREARPTLDARSPGNSSGGTRMAGENARQEDLYLQRAEEIQHILRVAQIAPKPKGKETVQIGHIITLCYAAWVEKTPGGPKTSRRTRRYYEIVGFREGDCDTTPARLCYEAGLAKHFVGESKGHKVLVRLDGEIRLVTLSNIKLPK